MAKKSSLKQRVRFPSMPVPGMFIVLMVDYEWPSDPLRGPAHSLAIPADWAEKWDGEWQLESRDFVDREEALQQMFRGNEAAEGIWFLAFEIGEASQSSFLTLKSGAAAEFFLDCSFSVIRPTEEEVSRICHAPKAKQNRGAA